MPRDDQQLVKALRQVRKELYRASNDKQAEYRRRQRDQFFLYRFFRRRNVDGSSSPSDYSGGRREQDQKTQLDLEMVRWTRAVANYTNWLFLVGVVAAVVAFFTLKAIQGQLAEMQAEQRAWVSFEPNITLTQGIEYDVNGMHWTINFPVHNTGHSPAAYVWIDSPLVTRGFGSKDEIIRRMAFINKEKRIPPVFDSGRYMFPGDRGDFTMTLGIGKDEMAQIEQSDIKFLKPAITVCIRYYFITEIVPHLTCVTTEMFTKKGLIAADNRAPIPIGDIVFRYFMLGPSFAN